MCMMKEVYTCAHPRLIGNFSRKLSVGEFVVAKVPDEEGQTLYIRGRILEIDPQTQALTLVDIDSQNKYSVPSTDAYWMFGHFYHSPTMV